VAASWRVVRAPRPKGRCVRAPSPGAWCAVADTASHERPVGATRAGALAL